MPKKIYNNIPATIDNIQPATEENINNDKLTTEMNNTLNEVMETPIKTTNNNDSSQLYNLDNDSGFNHTDNDKPKGNEFGKYIGWSTASGAINGVLGGLMSLGTTAIQNNFIKKAQDKADNEKKAQDAKNLYNATGYDPSKY